MRHHRSGRKLGRDTAHRKALYANLADFLTVASKEEAHLKGLAERVSPAPVMRVPFLDTDVHDLDGLAEVARYLFPREAA